MRLGAPGRPAWLVLAAAAVAAASSWSPAAASTPSCAVAGQTIAGVAHSHVLATDRATIVYRVRGHSADAWWACRAGRAPRAFIGTDDSFQKRNDEYGPSRTLSDLRIAGRWVVAVGASGLADYETCSKYQQSPCTGPTETLLAADATTPRGPGTLTQFQTDTSDANGNGTDIVWKRVLLSPAGAVAWLLRSEAFTQSSSSAATFTIYGCVLADGAGGPDCTPTQVASGATIPSSLGLSGTTLTWTADGQSQSASLS